MKRALFSNYQRFSRGAFLRPTGHRREKETALQPTRAFSGSRAFHASPHLLRINSHGPSLVRRLPLESKLGIACATGQLTALFFHPFRAVSPVLFPRVAGSLRRGCNPFILFLFYFRAQSRRR